MFSLLVIRKMLINYGFIFVICLEKMKKSSNLISDGRGVRKRFYFVRRRVMNIVVFRRVICEYGEVFGILCKF